MKAKLKTVDTKLVHLNGFEITDINPMDEKFYDREHVGYMFTGVVDGKVRDLFEDEIVYIPSDEVQHGIGKSDDVPVSVTCKESMIDTSDCDITNNYGIVLNGDEYTMITESNGNTFLVLGSYLEQEAGPLVSPYGNGVLTFEDDLNKII